MTLDRSGELERISYNHQTLLYAIPELVLLIKAGKSIEFMNTNSIDFFGELRNVNVAEVELCNIRNRLISLVDTYLSDSDGASLKTGLINDFNFEYTVAPFIGYKGDDLFWLILKDVTKYNAYKEEIAQYNKSIESVLAYKVGELKESELIRKNLNKQLEDIKQHLELRPTEGVIIGSSRAMIELHDMIMRVAKSDATILITGESGTGKELAANLICETSDRKDKPFLKINCNTINDQLLESDLFGYEKGAFTDAKATHKGKFEIVDGGTIFLDEIGDISPRMQAALLRVLQAREIIRVGGNTPIKVDVRIIAATNIDLLAAVQAGTFRLDLYYRLNIINLSIPPLRERKEDIIELVAHFVKRYRKAFRKDVTHIPNVIIDKLLMHDWPGNIRELENIVQRAVLMSKTNIINEEDVIFDASASHTETEASSFLEQFNGAPLKSIVSAIEREVITNKLKAHQGNVSEAAREMEICVASLYDKMRRYEISAKKIR